MFGAIIDLTCHHGTVMTESLSGACRVQTRESLTQQTRVMHGLKSGFKGFHFGPLEPKNNEIRDVYFYCRNVNVVFCSDNLYLPILMVV